MSLNRAVVSVASILLVLLVSAAIAQQQTASTACNANNRGTVNCPTYTAPAATAVPGTSMDGSLNVPNSTSTTLFNGKVPPNAFIVQIYDVPTCFVNDNGPAGNLVGFKLLPIQGTGNALGFITPPGYKPIGPVSIWCDTSGLPPVYVAARGW
jgi:hypothetical protein